MDEKQELEELRAKARYEELAAKEKASNESKYHDSSPFVNKFNELSDKMGISDTLGPDKIGQLFLGGTPVGMGSASALGQAGLKGLLKGGIKAYEVYKDPIPALKGLLGKLEGGASQAAKETLISNPEASQGVLRLLKPQQEANKLKNKGWDFPIRKNRVGMD